MVIERQMMTRQLIFSINTRTVLLLMTSHRPSDARMMNSSVCVMCWMVTSGRATTGSAVKLRDLENVGRRGIFHAGVRMFWFVILLKLCFQIDGWCVMERKRAEEERRGEGEKEGGNVL